MSKEQLSGLKDKLYWREVGAMNFHCFKRVEGSRGGTTAHCRSLCGRHEIKRSGGQASRRPESILRCGYCDGAEMQRRGWEESGPTLEPRLPKGHPLSEA